MAVAVVVVVVVVGDRSAGGEQAPGDP